jgi:predicted small lipoprotein YifL
MLKIGILGMALTAALLAAGCGVNGPLEPPPGIAADQKAAPDAPKGQHQPFILDGILR